MNEPSEQHPDALLADYAVANLPSGQRRAVEGHLAQCARCRARLAALEATATLLRRLPAPNLPRSFVLPDTAPPPRRTAPWLLPVSFLSAAAVLFLALGLSLAAPRPTAATAYSYAAPQSPAAAAADQRGGAATTAERAAATPAGTAAAATSAASAAASTSAAVARSEGGSSAAARAAPAAQIAAAPAAAPTANAAPPTQAPVAAAPPASQPRAANAPTGPPAATPIRTRVLPYQVLLTAGGVVCLLVGLGALFRAARLRR